MCTVSHGLVAAGTFLTVLLQGGPSGAVLALKNPGLKVEIADLSESRIAAWRTDALPIYEPGLLEVVKTARDGGDGRQPNLSFTTDVNAAIHRADIVFICVNTPTKTAGTGAGMAPDLAYFESATRMVAKAAESDKIVVEKSTVPCRTADSMRDIFRTNGREGVNFDILSNPEFLAEGTAVTDLMRPDRILLGSMPNERGVKAAGTLTDLYATWVPREKILTTNVWSSELAKLAANALLAQRISSINALSAVCEATGADVGEIAFAAGLDSRIGPKMLQSSVGFGGSCFRKDVLNLTYMAESLHLPEVAAYWHSVVTINEWSKARFVSRILRRLHNTLTNKKIAVFGFAYKKNTSDTRESAAISVVHRLIAERAKVQIYDPKVTKTQIWEELQAYHTSLSDIEKYVTVHTNAYAAAEDAHAVVILTEWDEFKNVETPVARHQKKVSMSSPATRKVVHRLSSSGDEGDSAVELSTGEYRKAKNAIAEHNSAKVDWSRIAVSMQRPAFVFDGRRVVDVPGLEKLGFQVESIGRASAYNY